MESDSVITHTECLKSQFAGANTFKGTRSHHRFIASKNSLVMKKTSKSVCSKEVSLSAGENSKNSENSSLEGFMRAGMIMNGISAMQTICW